MNTRTTRLGLTTSEAARHLGVSLSTIRRWSDMGYLKGYRTPGGQRRFSADQLDAFIASLEASGPRRPAPAEGEDEPRFESRPHTLHTLDTPEGEDDDPEPPEAA
jgi:excisionase family DNA binding protein